MPISNEATFVLSVPFVPVVEVETWWAGVGVLSAYRTTLADKAGGGDGVRTGNEISAYARFWVLVL